MIEQQEENISLDVVSERIIRYRRVMIVHSYLYYVLNDPIISDETWQTWANELRDLQKIYGTVMNFYDEEFKDWDGTTGYHLPQKGWVISTALRLLRAQEKRKR